MSYKVFYINLDRSIDRKNHIEKELSKTFSSNIINRFPAIDKNNLTKDYIKTILNPRAYYYLEINNHKRSTHEDINSNGHIACYLSHLEIWKKLLDDSSVDYYIIFEDDVKINDTYKVKLDRLLKSKTDFDWVSLIYISRRINDKIYDKNKDLFVLKNPFFGMQSYILNKKAANALVKWSTYLSAQVDGAVGYVAFYEDDLKFFMYKENLGYTGIFYSDLDHRNCIHCEGDDLFNIRIKAGFGWIKKNILNKNDDKNITINLKIVFIVILILSLIIYLYRQSKNRRLQFSS
jgi:GR25 family glycosyltransferase involved in LPS biosynthesis